MRLLERRMRGASAAVFNLIGDPRELLTCPPLDADALPIEGLSPSRLSYFNLHGIEDGAEHAPHHHGGVVEISSRRRFSAVSH
jgi:hypothetical protein